MAVVTDDFRAYGFADDKELTGIDDLKEMACSDVYKQSWGRAADRERGIAQRK